MAYQLEPLRRGNQNIHLDAAVLQRLIDRLVNIDRPRYRRLWAYHRNPMRPAAVGAGEQGSERPYRQAQEWGLPSRITGFRSGLDVLSSHAVGGVGRKEVVIENDIGWRIETMVDYLFGKPMAIHSAAPDPQRREVIGRLLRMILARNGGIQFLQQLALLGAVYGFVDVLVKLEPLHDGAPDDSAPCGTGDLGQSPLCNEPSTDGAGASPGDSSEAPAESLTPPAVSAPGEDDSTTDAGASEPSPDALLQRIARMIRLEIVEPARALPVLCPADYRAVEAYVQIYELPGPAVDTPRDWMRHKGLLGKTLDALRLSVSHLHRPEPSPVQVIEILTADHWQRYENEVLQSQGNNSLGIIPLVHIQNTAVPFQYAGTSDVEPLIPLQDELNSRLSDRASRITLQSFKMYLGKGIEGFNQLPVAPGRMWATDNERAEVIEFGGDGGNPSEEAHISDIREAIDKASGVTPIAAGAIKGRIGRLTSAAALRVTLLALLARTEKKRTTYGAGIERMCELALAWLDRAGVFRTRPEERRVELSWPSPLPENDQEQLQSAEAKARLGVPREVLLRELGY